MMSSYNTAKQGSIEFSNLYVLHKTILELLLLFSSVDINDGYVSHTLIREKKLRHFIPTRKRHSRKIAVIIISTENGILYHCMLGACISRLIFYSYQIRWSFGRFLTLSVPNYQFMEISSFKIFFMIF